MPFLAQCVFCNHQVQVPDEALGASGRCPKCGSFYTLAPATNLPPVKTSTFARGKGPPPAAPELAAPAAVTEAPPPRLGLPASAPAQGVSHPAPADMEIVGAGIGPAPAPRWLEPFGLVALLLGGAALLCASVPRPWSVNNALALLVVPASALGLAAGLAGLARAASSGRFQLLLPAAGAVVGGAVLVLAWQWPGLLGPDYLAFRARDLVDPATVRVIPLSGKAADAEGLSPDWVDARLAALQQGPVRVQVVSVTVGPLESKSGAKKQTSPEKYLVLRLRSQRIEDAAQLAADPGGMGQAAVPRGERPHLKLSDYTGKTYQEKVLAADSDSAGEMRQSSHFPVAVADDVFVFEAPPASLESLSLEVPTAAWGGSAVFRFTIPRAMFRQEPARVGKRSGS
jgi:hypothetical protein